MPTRQCTGCTHGLDANGDCTNRSCEMRAEPSGKVDTRKLIELAKAKARTARRFSEDPVIPEDARQ